MHALAHMHAHQLETSCTEQKRKKERKRKAAFSPAQRAHVHADIPHSRTPFHHTHAHTSGHATRACARLAKNIKTPIIHRAFSNGKKFFKDCSTFLPTPPHFRVRATCLATSMLPAPCLIPTPCHAATTVRLVAGSSGISQGSPSASSYHR
jgi:hypothetical protein